MRSDAPARIYTNANKKYRLPVRLETTSSFRRTVSQKNSAVPGVRAAFPIESRTGAPFAGNARKNQYLLRAT